MQLWLFSFDSFGPLASISTSPRTAPRPASATFSCHFSQSGLFAPPLTCLRSPEPTPNSKAQKKKSVEELLVRMQYDEHKRKLKKENFQKMKEEQIDREIKRVQLLHGQPTKKKLSKKEADTLILKLTQDAERRK